MLVANGADPKIPDSLGNTAIIQCITYAHRSLKFLNFLIKQGCDPCHKNDLGLTALHRASSIGHFEVVKRLLQFGVPPMFQPALPRPADGQYVPCPLFLSINIHSCNAVSDILMSREDCPVSCTIDALKLRAAKSYICGNNISHVEWWLKAVELEETLNEPLPTHNDSENFYSIEEVHTVQQLNQMYIDERNRPGTIMMQCLVVVERCLGGNDYNMKSVFQFVEKATYALVRKNLHEQTVVVCSRWQQLIERHLSRLSIEHYIVDSTHICLWFNVIANNIIVVHNSGIVKPDLKKIVTFGTTCFNFLYNRGVEKMGRSTWRFNNYDFINKAVLKLLFVRVEELNHDKDLLQKRKALCDEVVDLFCRYPFYLNFIQPFFDNFDFNNEINVQILENFLSNDKVFKNINKMLFQKTIIGTFLSFSWEYDIETVKKIVDLLVDNGAHVDCVDRNGHCSLDLENRSTVGYECLKHKLPLSLMCLSARAVIHQKIDYDILPCHCKQFVSLHDPNR